MPGGYGTDESTPWGSSGTSYVSTRSQAPPGRDPGGHHFGGDDQSSQAAQEASQALHAKQMQEMARGMQAAGQISGGLSGGTYTKGPVVYPKHWYTNEGWGEVQQRGWSSKLNPEFQYDGKWSITDDKADEYGRFQTLPEGVIYSSNIGDPERGYGGFKRVSNFTGGNTSGGPGPHYGGDYYSGGGGGGGGGGGYREDDFMPQGNAPDIWDNPNSLQQAMISIHGGQGFQQGFRRGGIVSLVT